MSDFDIPRLTFKAAFANLEVAIHQNGLATNALTTALCHVMNGNNIEANRNIEITLEALRDARKGMEGFSKHIKTVTGA